MSTPLTILFKIKDTMSLLFLMEDNTIKTDIIRNWLSQNSRISKRLNQYKT